MYVFIIKFRSIPEEDFLNLQIYIQSLKYNWSILFELMHFFFQTQKHTWGGLYFIYLHSNSEVYFQIDFLKIDVSILKLEGIVIATFVDFLYLCIYF